VEQCERGESLHADGEVFVEELEGFVTIVGVCRRGCRHGVEDVRGDGCVHPGDG